MERLESLRGRVFLKILPQKKFPMSPLGRVFDEIPASLESLAKSVRLQSQACQIVWAVECSPPTVAWIDPAVQDLIVPSLSKDSQVHHSLSSSDRVGEEFEDS